jgi:hypothetical protein
MSEMTDPTSDSGTVFKTLLQERPWKVRALHMADPQKDVLGHRIAGPGSRDHRVKATPINGDVCPHAAAPLNTPSAEAAGKKRFP